MKKIVSILSTGLSLLAAFSCTQVEKITVNNKDSVAPVLGTVTVGSDIVAAYTPATFYLGDDVVSPTLVTHTIALVKLDGEDLSVNLNAKDSGTTLKVAGSNLSNALKGLGCEANSTHAIELVVRAALSSTANTGFLDSESRIEANWTVVEKSGGDPYAGWEASTWGVTGSIASAGLNWDKDIAMLTDGTWHVAKGVALTTSDEFKFRKDGGWDVNFGGDFVELDTEFAVTQGGPNIKVTADGTYDLFLNPDAGLAYVIVTGSNASSDPYAGFEATTTWGVIGSIASTGNSWNADEPMFTDGTWYVCKSLVLTTSDEFKFRQDAAWAVNFGGDFVEAGAEFAVTQDGPNIKVTADGTYDVLLNPDSAVAKVVVSGEDPGI